MSTTIIRPRHGVRRALAGVMTTALAASGLALLPGTAQAATTGAAPTLTWKISQQFVDHLSTQVLSDGASFDATTGFTFTNGVGYSDSGNGVSRVAYQGTVKGGFVNAGKEFYSVTVKDPIVTVDAAGEGTISAVVSSANAALGPNPADSTSPERVVVTTFDASASDWTGSTTRSLTDTPDWAGVLESGSQEATGLGITSGKPVDGKSFAPSFLSGIVSGVRAHFYASGSSSDAKKNPATFTATIGAPSTSVTTASATPDGGLSLAIAGTGFTRSTNPGDSGIYVGLAPSGGLPDTSTFDISSFAGANWVTTAAIDETTGSFASTINAPAAKLDPTTSHSLYTWRAHTHSTPSQNSETPVAIDFSSLRVKVASTSSLDVAPAASGQAGTATVTVAGAGTSVPTGTVSLSGATNQTVPLSGGTARFTLPSTWAAGATSLTVTYSGDATYAASGATRTFTVAKAAATVTRNKITKKPTTRKSGKTSIRVRSAAPGAVAGKAIVTFSKKGKKTKTKTVKVKNGIASVTIPRLSKGTWNIKITFAGSTNVAKATASAGSVKVTKK